MDGVGSRRMKPVSHARHRFPADVIRQAVRRYFRFAPSFRNVEDLMAGRGIGVSCETIRCWTWKFGRLFAGNLRRTRPGPTGRWQLDEMLARKRRNKQAAPRLPRKLLKRQGIHPETIVTDGLASYGAATHAAVYNTFNVQRHLVRRSILRHFRTGAMATWNAATRSA